MFDVLDRRRACTIFRVDNPHTKPFAFWEWVIARGQGASIPRSIFLAEAFTRPKVMYRLAKLGFIQSYTYFTWRNTKHELTEYFTELTQHAGARVLPAELLAEHAGHPARVPADGGRPAFMARLVLAATLAASYGIYGPAFELWSARRASRAARSTSTRRSTRSATGTSTRRTAWRAFIARVNRIRRENPALQRDWSLRFHAVDNDQLICYARRRRTDNVILVVVNLDPHHAQSGWVELDLEALGLEPTAPFQVHDLLTDARFLWHGARNFVELDPHALPAHIFGCVTRVRTERDFDYFLTPLAIDRRGASPPTQQAVTAPAGRSALVQGRGHLPAARQGVLRLATATASATSTA